MRPRDLWSVVRSLFHAVAPLSVGSLILADTLAFAQAAPPAAFGDTTYSLPTGTTCQPLDGPSLQAALDATAPPCDVIELQAGTTYTGKFILRNKSGSGWTYVISSALGNLPEGTRVNPTTQAAFLPKIVSPNLDPAIQAEFSAHNYRFAGIEITTTCTACLVSCVDPPPPEERQCFPYVSLVQLGYDPTSGAAATSVAQLPTDIIFDRCYIHGTGSPDPDRNVRRGIALNSVHSAVIDSHLSDLHEVGGDSQAIAVWNGPGPYKIANNYLAAAGENIIFGGSNPSIDQLVPSDIEVRGNHLFKPLSWNVGHPSYAGTPWTVKSLFELKNARRVLVEGNVLENNWSCPDSCQSGFAILFTPRNQKDGDADLDATWSVVADVTFRRNIVRSSQVNGQPEQGGGVGGGFNILGADDNHPSKGTERIVIRDNVLEDVQTALGTGSVAQILPTIEDANHPVGYPNRVTIDHNTAFHDTTLLNADSWPDVPPNNGKADRFVFNNNIAPKGVYGISGTETSEGLPTLNAYFPGYTVNKDLIQGADCALYPAGTLCPATFDGMFVDQPNHNYRLVAPPYKGGGTDLQDIGADIDGVDEATAGAVSGAPPAVVPVTWTNLMNVTANGNWSRRRRSPRAMATSSSRFRTSRRREPGA